MRLLYAIPIVLLPNAAHLPSNVSVSVSVAAIVIAILLGDREEPYLARASYLLPPLIALFLAMLIAFVAAQWSDLSNFGADLREAKVAVLFPFLYLAYRRCGLDLKGTRQMIMLMLLVAVLAGLEAVFQGLSFNLGSFSNTERATGPFGPINMANRAGVFFAMFLPFLVALVLQPNQRRSVRLAAIAGSVILAFAILFTYSRQAYLIGLFGMMVLLVWRSIPAALLAAVLLVATAASFLPSSVVERVQETQQVDATGAVTLDASTSSRFVIWNGTMNMLRDHPAGVGLGRFDRHIGDYTPYGRPKDAHNGFVLTLAECGPLGLLALLWVFWRLWRLSRWLRRSPGAAKPELRTFELGFTLAVISMALGNMYGSPFFDSVIMANFWVLCGLMERYGRIKAHSAALSAEASEPTTVPLVPVSTRFPLAVRAVPGLARLRDALR
ncbi:O-antigen ligase family protein [Lysobacter sp. P5_B9]